MEHILYLTAEEQAAFKKLPAGLREAAKVTEETQSFSDSAEDRTIRFELLRVSDPAILEFRKRLTSMNTVEDFAKAVESFDTTKVSDKDFCRLVFALGPEIMGMCILELLQNAISISDVEKATAFSLLRHEMLESLISTANAL